MISDKYKKLLTDKHDAKPWGGAGKSWIPWILKELNLIPPLDGPIKVLDYGCGRGTLKPALEELQPDVIVSEYDPGVRGKDTLDLTPVEYVVCTDVMEHVEEQFVDDTLKVISFLAIEGAFFNIDLGPSKSLLPDGTNTHITQKPAEWWHKKLMEHFADKELVVLEKKKGRTVVALRKQCTSSL